MKTKVAIIGYGNLGKGVEVGLTKTNDMELFGVFTRRPKETVQTLTNANVYNMDELDTFKDDIDVAIICSGSATDLPKQTPYFANYFNVVDSFDTHAKINEHFNNVNASCIKSGKIGVISVGWDPGMFSLARLYSGAVLPNGKDYTFWGTGVSQGHSDAVRQIEGVIDARQYTIPVEEALDKVRSGLNPELTTREKHTRLVYVVADENADKCKIEEEIVNMPNYFADYDTTVKFISLEEMKKDHSGLPHGGVVIRSGNTGLNNENKHIIEYKLTLDSNPQFTSSVLIAYARAAVRLNKEGFSGCKTVFDIPPAYLHEASDEELRKNLL